MTESEQTERTGGLSPELAGLLLSEETMSGLLDVIVNLAATAVEGVDGASVSLVVREGQRAETTNASSPVIRDVDEAQYAQWAGPCGEAIRTGQEVRVTMPTPDWPDFSQRATDAQIRSVWSLPLQVRDRTTGALNLYARGGQPWQGPAAGAAPDLAGQASIVLANAAALISAQEANQRMERALASRDLIGQAKGILMAREAINADQAFDILRRASQRTNRKLRQVAAELVAGVEHRESEG